MLDILQLPPSLIVSAIMMWGPLPSQYSELKMISPPSSKPVKVFPAFFHELERKFAKMMILTVLKYSDHSAV